MTRRRRDPEQIYRDVMAKFDPATRDRVQGVIIDYGVEKADPFFLVFLAMGHLLTLVEEAPENWQVLFDEFKGDLDAWTTQNLRTLEAINQQSQTSKALIQSFQELSNLTISSSSETKKLHSQLSSLNSELERLKSSLSQTENRIESSNQSIVNRFAGIEKKVKALRSRLTWTLACSIFLIALLLVGGTVTYGRLTKELHYMQLLMVSERRRSIWTLEKANRAECWYGIKPASDPQCRQYQ